MRNQSMHVDPEFETFTYGDPTRPKASLLRLKTGDLLAFYAGLEGWHFPSAPVLYIIGYFEVEAAGLATRFTAKELQTYFARNFHVRHPQVFQQQKAKLVLLKGGQHSRLLAKARLISSMGKDRRGRPLKVLAPELRNVFGNFGGRLGIQRSTPRWVEPSFVERAAQFVKGLE